MTVIKALSAISAVILTGRASQKRLCSEVAEFPPKVFTTTPQAQTRVSILDFYRTPIIKVLCVRCHKVTASTQTAARHLPCSARFWYFHSCCPLYQPLSDNWTKQIQKDRRSQKCGQILFPARKHSGCSLDQHRQHIASSQ
jgi:hypothetical protein